MSKRTILITGASSGIGRATSLRLASEGHRVIGVARDFSKFPKQPAGFTAITIDLSDLDSLPEKMKSVLSDHPAIDAALLNAGRGHFGMLEQFSAEQIRSLIDLNFTSQALAARAIVPHLKTMGRGDIIFMGSEAALAGKKRGTIYCASKFAVRGFAQALRDECGSAGVRVSLINPGMVRTPFFDELEFGPSEEPGAALEADDVARAVSMILNLQPGTNVDEVNLSPRSKKVEFKAPRQ